MLRYWQPLSRHSCVTLWTTIVGFGLAVVFGVALGAHKLDIEGIAMYAVFAYVERKSTRWAFRSSMSAGA